SLAPEAGTLVLAGEGGADGGDGTRSRSWADVLAEGERAGPAAPYGTWFDSPGFWLYPSGTTGTPKAAMHRHGSIARVCETYAQQVLGITPEDRCYSVAKLFFAYGIGNSLFFPFSVGATAVLDPARATPAGAAARLAEDRPSLFFAGPAFFAALLAADVPAEAFASVRLGASGAAGVGPAGAGAGRGLPRRDLPPVPRPLRGRHHRRAGIHRGAAHLHLQPARRRPPRDVGHRGPRVRGPAGGRPGRAGRRRP